MNILGKKILFIKIPVDIIVPVGHSLRSVNKISQIYGIQMRNFPWNLVKKIGIARLWPIQIPLSIYNIVIW